MEATWNCPEGKNCSKVEWDQINDWLSLYGSTVRYVQLRGSQSAQEGSYILSGLHAPLGTHNKLGDAENNFCRASFKPIATYPNKMAKMFHCPSHNVILGISPLFILQILQILMFIRDLLWPGYQECLSSSQSINNTIFLPKIVPLFSCVTHLDSVA